MSIDHILVPRFQFYNLTPSTGNTFAGHTLVLKQRIENRNSSREGHARAVRHHNSKRRNATSNIFPRNLGFQTMVAATKNETSDGEERQMSPRNKTAPYLRRKQMGRQSSNDSHTQDSCSTATTAASSIAPVKEVYFNLELNVVHYLDPLWGSRKEKKAYFFDKEELVASRQHGRYIISFDNSAKTYIDAFDQSYKQVHTTAAVHAKTFHGLVQGSKFGFRGLEQNYGRSSRRRKTMVRHHVLAIVNLHHVKKFGSEVDFAPQCEGAGGAPHWRRNATVASPVDTSKVLCELSTQLSAGNRRFALLLGKVDCMAVDDEDVDVDSFALSSLC